MEFRDVNTQNTRQRIERLPAIIERTGLSRSSIYALIAKDEFAKPVKLSLRAIGFISEEVDEWIAARGAARH